MRRPAAVFPIVLALGAISVASGAGAREGGPIEIATCQTISKPGSYKLVDDLGPNPLLPPRTCVVITANFVTIDLAGFSITGPDSEMGILAAPSSSGLLLQGIAVRNGSISHFGTGVDLSSADGSIVEGLRVFGGSLGSGLGIVASGIVKGNTVTGIRGTGISATGTVTRNYSTGNLVGIEIGQGSTVIGNTALHNVHDGLSVLCPSNLTDNTAVNTETGTNLVLNGEGCHNEDNVAP